MKKTLAASALALAFSACLFESEPKTPSSSASTWIQIGDTTTAAGYEIHLYAKSDSLGTGYRPLRVCLHNHKHPELQTSGKQIEFLPFMKMMSKSHASPVENPGLTDSEGCSEGAVVFTMPSNEMEGWTLGFKIGGDSARIPLWIKSQDQVLMTKDPADTAKRVLIAWVSPQKLQVGSQDIELALFSKTSMMDFPRDSSWSFDQWEPTMPSMGHGSPNNVSPTFKGGHYVGKLNFTMSGDWQIALGLHRGQDSLKNLTWNQTVLP